MVYACLCSKRSRTSRTKNRAARRTEIWHSRPFCPILAPFSARVFCSRPISTRPECENSLRGPMYRNTWYAGKVYAGRIGEGIIKVLPLLALRTRCDAERR